MNLPAVSRFLTEALDADGSIVFLIDQNENELNVGAVHPAAHGLEKQLKIPVGYGVTGLVASKGHAVTLVDDSPRNKVHRALLGLRPDQTVSRMCAPAHGTASRIVGVISVHRRGSTSFTEDDLKRAQVYADLIGLRLFAEGLLGDVEEHQAQRNRLIEQASSAQEAERRRIAGDLHDGVTQARASLAFHLSAADVGLAATGPAERRIGDAQVQISAARRLATLAYDETRAAIRGLHSLILEDLGLVSALESLTQVSPQLDIEFRTDLDEISDVPDHCAAVLFRIAQEGINNVVKHAEAGHAVLSLRRAGDAVVLAITDDGVGFDLASARAQRSVDALGEHFGLSSVAERCALIGASLRIDSVAGRGTAVIVELPL
ncbi:MAG: GAF domain-containing sensor histidine kinase [Flavobacterium sp.]|nr:GAF domain-containing sensor histidine kinase [Aeromicrobium sp.]